MIHTYGHSWRLTGGIGGLKPHYRLEYRMNGGGSFPQSEIELDVTEKFLTAGRFSRFKQAQRAHTSVFEITTKEGFEEMIAWIATETKSSWNFRLQSYSQGVAKIEFSFDLENDLLKFRLAF